MRPGSGNGAFRVTQLYDQRLLRLVHGESEPYSTKAAANKTTIVARRNEAISITPLLLNSFSGKHGTTPLARLPHL